MRNLLIRCKEPKPAGGSNAAPRSDRLSEFHSGIPWRVALQQSSPPLSRTERLCKTTCTQCEKISANGKRCSFSVSQKFRTPHYPRLSASICGQYCLSYNLSIRPRHFGCGPAALSSSAAHSTFPASFPISLAIWLQWPPRGRLELASAVPAGVPVMRRSAAVLAN
jgi:hypothetical protein